MTGSGLRNIAFSKPCFDENEPEAAAAAVASRWVVGGPRLAQLEQRFAELCGVSCAVGVSSWTTGAFLALKALGVGPGDEVIVPSLTFIASVNVIAHVGATPVFADVDAHTFNIDPLDVAAKVTSRTKAILPVDQIGLPCEIDQILAIADGQGLLVLHDAACSFASRFRGRPIGSLAPVTVFSLHARKVVTTGEGGIVVTNDQELAARLRRLRHQGMSLTDFERHGGRPTVFESYPEVGYNFRLTDVQAAIGVAQLAKLDRLLARRSVIARAYIDALSRHPFIEPPFVPAHVTPNWQSFQVTLGRDAPMSRNAVMEKLHERGVATRRGVMASHLEPPYRHLNARLPVTEAVAASTLQLPIYPDLSDTDVEYVIEVLASLG